MTDLTAILEKEQVILDPEGRPEYVVLPIAKYERLIQLLEDYGTRTGHFSSRTGNRHTKSEALAFLEGR